MALWGAQVCLHSWGQGSYPVNFTPTLLTLNEITRIAVELRG